MVRVPGSAATQGLAAAGDGKPAGAAALARPLLVDEGAARGRDVAVGSILWGGLMAALAAVALGVI